MFVVCPAVAQAVGVVAEWTLCIPECCVYYTWWELWLGLGDKKMMQLDETNVNEACSLRIISIMLVMFLNSKHPRTVNSLQLHMMLGVILLPLFCKSLLSKLLLL